MKKLTIRFSFNEKNIVKEVFINDDINTDTILADTPENKDVSAECGMGDELYIWELSFTDKNGTSYECDFKSIFNEGDDTETLTLEPVEVLVWSKSGKSLNNNVIPFEVAVE